MVIKEVEILFPDVKKKVEYHDKKIQRMDKKMVRLEYIGLSNLSALILIILKVFNVI